MSIFPSIENLLITSTEVIIGFCRHSSETRRFFSVRNVTKRKVKNEKVLFNVACIHCYLS